MGKKKEDPFATITIKLYENKREVDIEGFKRISERILEDLPRFIRTELFVLRSSAARAQRVLEREEEADAAVSKEDVSTEDKEPISLPSSVEEIEAVITKEISDG